MRVRKAEGELQVTNRCQVDLHSLRRESLVCQEGGELAQEKLSDGQRVKYLMLLTKCVKPFDTSLVSSLGRICYTLSAVKANRLVQAGEHQLLLGSIRRSTSCWGTGVGS